MAKKTKIIRVEEDFDRDDLYYRANFVKVTGRISLDGDLLLYGSLVIANGATLTVHGRIMNLGRGVVTVRPGGLLVLGGVEVQPLNLKNLIRIAPLALAPGALKMEVVHTCKTTHCLGGWAVAAIPGGRDLSRQYGWYQAGLMLLGHKAGRMFFVCNGVAKKWLKQFVGKMENA